MAGFPEQSFDTNALIKSAHEQIGPLLADFVDRAERCQTVAEKFIERRGRP